MIFSITNPTELVDWLQIFCKSGWLSPWDPPLQWGKIHEEFTAPQHTRFILPPIHPNKIHRCAAWAVFFFSGEDCTLKISWAVRTWYRLFVNAAAQTGAGTSFGSTGDSIYEQEPFTCFFVLTIRKQLPEMCFERSDRGQEPSRGHKFSILENFLFIRDFASQTLASFLSDLVGACLPQTLPSNNKVHNCSMDWV